MAKKPTGLPPAPGTLARRKAARPASSPKSQPAPGGRAVDGTSLRRELTAAKARIVELEKDRRELSRRIEAAIATLNKLLKS